MTGVLDEMDLLLRINKLETAVFGTSLPCTPGISIVIPTYEQVGHGPRLLTELLQSILNQNITVPYEVVIIDSCRDSSIKEVFDKFNTYRGNSEHHRYERCEANNACHKINAAIDAAKYDKIKLMCQDDIMIGNAIDLFSKALDKHDWVIANSITINERSQQLRKHSALYTHNFFRKNLVGMPSVIGFRKNATRLNPNLTTCIDMYFYHQLYELFGEPGYVQQYCIGQRYHNASLSRQLENTHDKDVHWLIENGLILK